MKILEQNDSGNCTKTLKIEIPREEVESNKEELCNDFISQASVPGFRKGKAPKKIVQMKYGKYFNEEAVSKVVNQALKEAISELELLPVTEPKLKQLDKEDKDKPIVAEIEVEYRPEIEPPDYSAIQIEPPSFELSEKDVVDTLNNLRERNAVYQTVEDRPARKGDRVTLSISATVEGEPLNEVTHDEIPIELGAGGYLPGLEEQLEGLSANEEKTFTLTLPDNYPNEAMRGQEAEFHVSVKEIKDKKLPELDDEFAKDMGPYETLDELKNQIRQSLQYDREQEREKAIHDQIQQKLLEQNPFDVPPSMVQARYNYINSMQSRRYQQYGVNLEEVVNDLDGLLAENERVARDDVRYSFLLHAIANKEGIELSDDEFVSYMGSLARGTGTTTEDILQRIESQGMEEIYRYEAFEFKVRRWLLEKILPQENQASSPEEVEAQQPEQVESAQQQGSQETEE